MEHAIRLARAAAVLEEIPVGAVIMQDGDLLAEAHNETIRRRDPTAHAELLAIHQALSRVAEDRLIDATMYVTLEPCAQCAGALVLAKIGRLVFGAYDNRAGMVGSVGDILRNPRLNHRAQVESGILAEQCGELLKNFFRARR
jgi:tRNA(adenine34) deaminase